MSDMSSYQYVEVFVLFLIRADFQFSKQCQLIVFFTLFIFIPGILNRVSCFQNTATTIVYPTIYSPLV